MKEILRKEKELEKEALTSLSINSLEAHRYKVGRLHGLEQAEELLLKYLKTLI
jgi:hypothetical protein